MGDRVGLRTYCSGIGARWAERTTTLTGAAGDLLQATAVWAAVSRMDGRPVPPGEAFLQVYGESAQDRKVSARLSHPRPSGGEPSRAWQLRAADFDIAGHVNNAIAWAAVEDLVAEVGREPVQVEVEYHRAMLPGCEPRMLLAGDDHERLMWLQADGHLFASARLTS
jgi:acyl-ACP thioesterase